MSLKEKLSLTAFFLMAFNLLISLVLIGGWFFDLAMITFLQELIANKPAMSLLVILLCLSGLSLSGLLYAIHFIFDKTGALKKNRGSGTPVKRSEETSVQSKNPDDKRVDHTSQKKLEVDLEQRKYLLEKVQQTAQIGYWIRALDKNEISLTWSKETCHIFGLSEDEFDGSIETFLKFVHPDDKEKINKAINNTLENGEPYYVDHRIIKRNGSVGWVNEQAEVIKDNKGTPVKLIGIVQDITERKAIEEVFREVNERYEILSKATNDAIWDWDIKGNIIFWNHGLQTIFNYPEDAIRFTLEWWKDKIHPDDLDIIVKSLEKAFSENKSHWNYTYRFRSNNGIYKYVFDRAYILYNEKNQPVRMIGSMQDITERMEALEEIRKLSFVASKTDNAVMITDPEEHIEWVNEGFLKMTGYSLDEIKGRTYEFLHGPETNPEVVKVMRERLRRGTSYSGELINYSKNGHKYWLKFNITPVFREDGKVKNFIFMQSDISFQKEFDNRITAIARELESLIENANVPIFGIDRNGYINEWNKVTAELCGFTKSEVLGRKWIEEMVAPDHHANTNHMLAKVLWGTPVANFELHLLTKNKKRLILLLSASPRRDAGKNISGAILVAQDITELVEYRLNLEKMVEDRTRALNHALQNEKELVDLKSKFVSIASHEFRTPLSTISLSSGYLKKFRQRLSTDDFNRKIDNIEKQVTHMTHLLDDVLMIGKAEAGKINVRLAEVHILDFFGRIATEIEQTTGHTHHIRIQGEIVIDRIQSDEKLLRNITINLLTNAIKFSPGAEFVDLILTNDSSRLTLQVRDYGVGIPAGEIDKIFDPFYRGSNVNAIQGTGLGLSIIKKAVDLLQGSIHVKSDMGKGSELTVFLPIIHE